MSNGVGEEDRWQDKAFYAFRKANIRLAAENFRLKKKLREMKEVLKARAPRRKSYHENRILHPEEIESFAL